MDHLGLCHLTGDCIRGQETKEPVLLHTRAIRGCPVLGLSCTRGCPILDVVPYQRLSRTGCYPVSDAVPDWRLSRIRRCPVLEVVPFQRLSCTGGCPIPEAEPCQAPSQPISLTPNSGERGWSSFKFLLCLAVLWLFLPQLLETMATPHHHLNLEQPWTFQASIFCLLVVL